VISSNLESKVGGSIVTSRVSQAGQMKRVKTRGREMLRRRNSYTSSPDVGTTTSAT